MQQEAVSPGEPAVVQVVAVARVGRGGERLLGVEARECFQQLHLAGVVDVDTGQLAPRAVEDPRVIATDVLEGGDRRVVVTGPGREHAAGGDRAGGGATEARPLERLPRSLDQQRSTPSSRSTEPRRGCITRPDHVGPNYPTRPSPKSVERSRPRSILGEATVTSPAGDQLRWSSRHDAISELPPGSVSTRRDRWRRRGGAGTA